MIIGVNSIIDIYEYFYQKKYDSPKYHFKPTTKAINRIQIFLTLLDKKYDLNTLGTTFLIHYFVFQFNRTRNQVFNRFASRHNDGSIKVGGRIQIYDVIGKSAFEYWLNRDVNFDFLLDAQLTVDIATILNRQDTLNKKRIETLYSEEIEKKRFFNTERGFVNCIERTSLYNDKSENCRLCKWRGDCKKVLKANYINIYKERQYGESICK